MTRKLVIHIGHGKTGTSYLQSFLEANAEVLAERQIYYPLYGIFGGVKRVFINSGNGDFLFSDDFSVFGTTLLSSEFLFDSLLDCNVFRKFLNLTDTEVTVVLYTRNLFELLISSWGQYVKMDGGVLDVNSYFTENNDFNFYNKVHQWMLNSKRLNFNLIIKNYSFHKTELIKSFFESALGMDVGECGMDFRNPEVSIRNRSLTVAEYFIQREFNKHLVNSSWFVSNELVTQLPYVNSEIPPFSRMAYDVALQKQLPEIKKINELIDVKERIICEDYDDLCGSMSAESEWLCISKEQIEILVKSISDRITSMVDKSYSDFDPELYLEINPDVRSAGIDPWYHFLKHGIEEGRKLKRY